MYPYKEELDKAIKECVRKAQFPLGEKVDLDTPLVRRDPCYDSAYVEDGGESRDHEVRLFCREPNGFKVEKEEHPELGVLEIHEKLFGVDHNLVGSEGVVPYGGFFILTGVSLGRGSGLAGGDGLPYVYARCGVQIRSMKSEHLTIPARLLRKGIFHLPPTVFNGAGPDDPERDSPQLVLFGGNRPDGGSTFRAKVTAYLWGVTIRRRLRRSPELVELKGLPEGMKGVSLPPGMKIVRLPKAGQAE